MVKCLTHGFRGFNGAVQRRLATLTVTMLISLCWQLSSEVDLRRIFDGCKRWANSGSHEFVNKNMVRYMRPHGRFAHCSCKNAALTVGLSRGFMLHFYTFSAPTARFGLLYRNILVWSSRGSEKVSSLWTTDLKSWSSDCWVYTYIAYMFLQNNLTKKKHGLFK